MSVTVPGTSQSAQHQGIAPLGVRAQCCSPVAIPVGCECPQGGTLTGRPRADTSRKPKETEKDGHGYRFVSRGEMEADIKAGRYLEHGEYEGNLYGTKIDSIRAVVEAGKMCILDVNPQVGDPAGGTHIKGVAGAAPLPGLSAVPSRLGSESAENG